MQRWIQSCWCNIQSQKSVQSTWSSIIWAGCYYYCMVPPEWQLLNDSHAMLVHFCLTHHILVMWQAILVIYHIHFKDVCMKILPWANLTQSHGQLFMTSSTFNGDTFQVEKNIQSQIRGLTETQKVIHVHGQYWIGNNSEVIIWLLLNDNTVLHHILGGW